MTTLLLDIRHLSKAYGATQALTDVSLGVNAGEIHAVIGENGAGKSTLINILAGVVRPDLGEIGFGGATTKIDSPQTAQKLGIGTVHQELSLSELLSVAENIFAAHIPSRFGLIDSRELRRRAEAIFDTLELSLDPDQPVGTLPVSSRQLVEIAKALSLDARLLLLDEPTSALNANEKEALFRLLRRLRAKGIGIIYISHHLHEVTALADRITVLRDGRVVATHQVNSVTPETLVKQMVGRAIDRSGQPTAAPMIGNPLLEVRFLASPNAFSDVSCIIHSGEIIGVAGLLGSGRGAFASCLAGVILPSRGDILLDGRKVNLTSLRQAMAFGIGYIPAERKTEGLFLELNLADNITAACLERFSRWGIFDTRHQHQTADNHIRALNIRAEGPQAKCEALSGGNQQKVLIAKWLERMPRLLILQEPTKGVDVAAKSEIHLKLRRLAAEGAAIIFVSSDLPEILALSHRILVMHRGRLTASLVPAATTEEEIMEYASGLVERAA
jgi:ABC-type sugar transport system ATPase subunit